MTEERLMPGIPRRVHLIGLGGVHLSGIAKVLAAWGHQVSGSDMQTSPTTDALASIGVTVFEGHKAEHIRDAELVVTTSAAKPDNPELVEAHARGIPALKRHEFIAKMLESKTSVCVAGTHGKTTTTGMIASMLVRAGRAPTYLVGGDVLDLGTNAEPGDGDVIVVEADEYDRAFLAYAPNVGVVTNVEPDHLDIYGTFAELSAAFRQFMSQVKVGGTIIACVDSARVRELLDEGGFAGNVETYALDRNADWNARDIEALAEGGQRFEVLHRGEPVGIFEIKMSIRHDVANALAAIAAGHAVGMTFDEMRLTLPNYAGARRRFELVGEASGVTVMDDYAHHPTEVADTVATARQRFTDRRIVACFQPHTYSRSVYLLEGFRTCFRGLDELLVLATYAAREPESAGMDARALAGEIQEPNARFVATFEEAVDLAVEMLGPGDVFFTIGAGDVEELGPMLLERLSRDKQTRTDYSDLARAIAEITDVREHEPLSRHTTFGIGGPADIYVVAKNSDDLADIVIRCREHDAPVFVLGSGSNILVSDKGIRGVVIENRARAVTGPEPDGEGGFRFRAESGASFASIARNFARHGYGGLEWASGIPGTLGGAVVFNAGAYGGCLGDVLDSIRVVNGTGAVKQVAAADLDLVYRGSSFTKSQYEHRVVIDAEFTLWPGDDSELMQRVRQLDQKRLAAQPRGRNAGSIFKNTPQHPAWRLIDQVGLRGHRIGDAMISEQHCNFFINAGAATATDMKALIDLARDRVREQFGVELELEVSLVGEGFDE